MKKASIFAIVILAVQIDRITQNPNHLFRNSTAFFFIANEALSIIENAGIIGIKLPNFLQSALVKLRNKNSILPEENSNKQEGKDQ